MSLVLACKTETRQRSAGTLAKPGSILRSASVDRGRFSAVGTVGRWNRSATGRKLGNRADAGCDTRHRRQPSGGGARRTQFLFWSRDVMAYSHFERRSALAGSFLGIANGASHLHIGSVAVFDAPRLDALERRLSPTMTARAVVALRAWPTIPRPRPGHPSRPGHRGHRCGRVSRRGASRRRWGSHRCAPAA